MAKKIVITFNNPANEANLDHLELWKSVDGGTIYTQLGSDIPLVTGAADYVIEDTVGIVDGTTLFYSARSYNATNEFSEIIDSVLVTTTPDAPINLVLTEGIV